MYEANPKTMNPGSKPEITGAMPRGDYEKTPFENFEDLTDKLLRVPKKEVDKLRKGQQPRKRKQD